MLFAEQFASHDSKPPKPELVGIAKLASASELLEAKRRVEYREIETRSYIGRCSSDRVPFGWTINPYRGCEFGCKYCYARYAHEFMELRDGGDFETKIFAKRFDRLAFASELRHLPDGARIGLGTATDPYQPAERRFGVTRAMLGEFAKWRGLTLWLTTKSDLVARDADLLAAIAKRHSLGVTLSITTTDADLARAIEPYAPRPELRLKAVRTLASKGIQVRVFASPVLPLINDGEESLESVATAARAAGAIWFGGNLLFLQPCAKKVFFPFLDDKTVRVIGVEAGGKGVDDRMEHCASLTGGRPGVLHGNRTYLLQDDDGQILEGFSISAGLDYPGIGPEHSWLHDVGRAEYVSITDTEALEAFQLCCQLEGIIPALEPSHALAHVMKIAPGLPKDHLIIMNMCGRGDKDIFTVAKHLGFDMKI